MTNVYEYFASELGQAPSDDSLRELPTDSSCGRDCVAAIDAAHTLAWHIQQAFGVMNDPRAHSKAIWAYDIIQICEDVVGCYWRG